MLQLYKIEELPTRRPRDSDDKAVIKISDEKAATKRRESEE